MNLMTFVMQAGSIRRAAQGAIPRLYNQGLLDDILTSGWFWGIVIFCGICVIIYNVVKDN